jgi:hypothetical protein
MRLTQTKTRTRPASADDAFPTGQFLILGEFSHFFSTDMFRQRLTSYSNMPTRRTHRGYLNLPICLAYDQAVWDG